MSESKTHPLVFDCYKCGKRSVYPKFITEGSEKDGVQAVVKRCVICSAENHIDLPDGWVAQRNEHVLRGTKKER